MTEILDESAVSEIEARALQVKELAGVGEFGEDMLRLCATVKHLRSEVAEYERTDLVPRSRYNVADAEAREAREQTKQLAHRAGEEIESLQSQLEQLRAENEALRKWQRGVEEREAAVCPEDVPFDEYIWALKKRAAQAREDRDELSTEMETCHSLLDQFYAKDPAMTSLDTLEKRLKLHLDELRPVITDGDVNGDD